ncbi:MAG TPA: type IV pilus twitching motility protein PilT [Candidatus Hydrogenedentes bacterium]|nr:type IV pilus twitching motility protein PilT [Candidatus Hydrogenedentota bacterium]HPG65468.1 type IV pilus twitching motility protein PilT [Candidatus Hydrogenedentota bacterium]
MMPFQQILAYAVKNGASDVHLTVGSPPAIRVDGDIRFVGDESLRARDTVDFLSEIMTQEQRDQFAKTGDSDLALGISGLGRFRVNVLRQRGSVGIVLRHVRGKILDFDALNLPPILADISDMRRGLVLVTGTTGSGKSTTLASMIDRINRTRHVHIITLEDPIEFLHRNQNSIVTQREVAIDTRDFHTALRAAMREDPDVILIGEMRDAATFAAAMSAAETGHLVFSTLHTTNVMMTMDRILDMFPPDQHAQIRSQVSLQLRAVISQRLMVLADGKGRVPAIEVMLNTPAIAQLIRENHLKQIPTAIAGGQDDGMQTFNMSLVSLIKRNLVTVEEAQFSSDNPDELKMNLQGIYLSQSRGGILKK